MEALFKPDPQIERPDDNLWVVPATDPDINKYIINALVHGKAYGNSGTRTETSNT